MVWLSVCYLFRKIFPSLTEETRSKMVISSMEKRSSSSCGIWNIFVRKYGGGKWVCVGGISLSIAHCQWWLLTGDAGLFIDLDRIELALPLLIVTGDCTPAFLLCFMLPLWALCIREHRHASLINSSGARHQGPCKKSLHWQGRVCARWYWSMSSSVSLPYLPCLWVRMFYPLFSRSRVTLGTIHDLWFCSGAFLDLECPFFPFSHVKNFIRNSIIPTE